MENKVFVTLIVPELDENYDLLMPVNRKIGNIIELINKFLIEQTKDLYRCNVNQNLYNHESGMRYNINNTIYETDIRNGTKLVLI